MTVGVMFMGLVPIMWSTGAGADVMKRIAAPMIGGIFTSFILELAVYPAIYAIWKWHFEVKKQSITNPVFNDMNLLIDSAHQKEDSIMKRFISVFGLLVLSFFYALPSFSAQHQHGGMSMGMPMKMDTKEVIVEGVKVTFQLMDNEEHKKMLKDMKMKEDIEPGTTHIISVTLTDVKSQKEMTDAQINMKVIDPKGKDQIKPLKYQEMMKSYEAYFNLPEKGKYQVIILFKIGDQKRDCRDIL